MKFTATMNKADIEAAIVSINKRGAKLDQDIHLTALSCAAHHLAHRDYTLLNRLWLAMPKGSRRTALTEWYIQFAGVEVNMDKANSAEKPFIVDAAKKPVDLAGGAAKPWFECKKEKAPDEEFNFEGLLAQLLKRAEAAGAAGKVVKGTELLKAVQEATYGADVVATADADAAEQE